MLLDMIFVFLGLAVVAMAIASSEFGPLKWVFVLLGLAGAVASAADVMASLGWVSQEADLRLIKWGGRALALAGLALWWQVARRSNKQQPFTG